MSNEKYLTRVELDYRQGVRNYRLLFGHPEYIVSKDHRYKVTNQLAFFKPGEIFGLDLWECNDFGTTRWSVYILQAAAPGDTVMRVPQVFPGAIVLLEAYGVERAKAVLAWLSNIELGSDPATLKPEQFLAADFRLKAAIPQRKRRYSRIKAADNSSTF